MSHIIFATIIISITIVGMLLALFFTTLKISIEGLGLGMLLGPLVVTYTHFLANFYLGIPFSLKSLFGVIGVWMAVLLAILLSRNQRISLQLGVKIIRRFSNVEKALLGILALLIGFVWLQDIVWPLFEWDALTLYDFRGKIIAAEGVFTPEILTKYFFGYPPLTSLLHSYGYMAEVVYVKIWYAYLYTGLLLTFYALLRKDTMRTLALFGAVLLAISPHILKHSLIAYTNLPYALYLSLGMLYVLSWLKSGKRAALLVGGLLVAGSSWVRLTEPFWVIAVVLIVVGVIRHRKYWLESAVSIVLIVFARQPWLEYKTAVLNLNSTTAVSQVVGGAKKIELLTYVEKISQVIPYVIKAIGPIIGPYMVLLTISLWLALRHKSFNLLRYHFVWLTSVAMIFYGTLILSINADYWNNIPGSITRMGVFLIIFFIAIIIKTGSLLKNRNS